MEMNQKRQRLTSLALQQTTVVSQSEPSSEKLSAPLLKIAWQTSRNAAGILPITEHEVEVPPEALQQNGCTLLPQILVWFTRGTVLGPCPFFGRGLYLQCFVHGTAMVPAVRRARREMALMQCILVDLGTVGGYQERWAWDGRSYLLICGGRPSMSI
jgi:hypothetical protein